jgi:TRAP-type C4-dicarboxylate transport system permease small subunit
MFQSINNNLNKLYKFSGYLAAFFLILVAVFILIGISSRIFGFYIRGLAEYSGYCMAAASFYALAFTFVEGGHIRITLFLEKASSSYKRFLEIWCLIVATIFSGYLSFYLWKMLLISYDFQERSEGADEILIWIPQTSVAIGSLIFFIAVLHLGSNKHDRSFNNWDDVIYFKTSWGCHGNYDMGNLIIMDINSFTIVCLDG